MTDKRNVLIRRPDTKMWLDVEMPDGSVNYEWSADREDAARFTRRDAELVAVLLLKVASCQGKLPALLVIETEGEG